MTPASILRGIRRRAATICCTHDVDLSLRLAREIGELVSRETPQKPTIAVAAARSDPVDKPRCAECAQPAAVRGLCQRHYSAARYAGRLPMHKPGQPRDLAPIAPVKPAADRAAPWDSWRVAGFVDDPRAAAPEVAWRGLPPPTPTVGTTEIQ